MDNLYSLIVSPRAGYEIKDATTYISYTLMNKSAADNLLSKTNISINSLSSNPYRRPLVRDKRLAAKGLRLLPVNNYNLFYIICEKTKRVFIISFMYSKRDWSRLFDDTEFENTGDK